jgi:hypothetical protein
MTCWVFVAISYKPIQDQPVTVLMPQTLEPILVLQIIAILLETVLMVQTSLQDLVIPIIVLLVIQT